MASAAARTVKIAMSVCWLAFERTRRRGDSAVVLYYHDIPVDRREAFGRQLDALQRLGILVDPLDLQASASRRTIAVTFDDGLASFAHNALPELAARGIPCAVFVPSGFLGRPPEWVTDGRYDLELERVMSAAELCALAPERVRVGSHTVGHVDLTRLSSDELERELTESRASLERVLQLPVTALSLPFGASSPAVLEACARTGYERVFTTVPRPVPLGGEVFVCDRVAAEPSDWQVELRLKVLGGYGWLVPYGSLKRRVRGAVRRSTARWRAR
jgi:peptidoglycan/xylan/chitin deacetylase (PgdA/CDA1 family)